MKTHPFQHWFPVRTALCLAVALVLMLSSGQAGEPKSKQAASAPAKKKTEKGKKVVITGSNIPEKADRLGPIPTTHSPVVIIDQRAIARTGRVTPFGVLGTQPYFR
jgi:hypothetical protein